jgi:hypothetical protein
MLARLERILGHGKVLRVRRANLDGIDRRIAQDLAVVGLDRGAGETRTQASRGLGVSAHNCRPFHGLNPPHAFKMDTTR